MLSLTKAFHPTYQFQLVELAVLSFKDAPFGKNPLHKNTGLLLL